MGFVMIFGTFDLLHPGHKYFIKQAKKHGQLIIVIARDRTVRQVKGKLPRHSEKQRLEAVKGLKLANKVVLGSLTDKYAAIKKYKPNVIALGYDQTHFVVRLEEQIKKFPPKADQPRAGKTKIIRLRPFKPKKYKTSIINNSFIC